MSNPIVEIEQGKLKGNVCRTGNEVQFYSFKGIPYAKPPVGELRFRVPEPPESWEGIRDATQNCNICVQFDKASGTIVGSEDCLYLNVYTPKLPTTGSASLPVMVFFHGGGFVGGDGTDDTRHGADFLLEKDVVVVSLNYRLGIFGFLCLDLKDAPGNMGLRDQTQALKWVQKNITSFGGDPNNLTIFGISAGGASVEYQVLSPMAKGLFHKAIAQSGSSLLHWAHNTHIKELAAKIPFLASKNINDNESILKCLKGLSAKELLMGAIAALLADISKGGIHFGFVPTVEKPGDWEPFLDKSPYDLLSSGNFTKVPYMSGFCTREGLLMLGIMVPRIEKLVKEKNFSAYLPSDLDESEKLDVEKRAKSIYLDNDNVYGEPDAFAIDFFTDVDFLGGIYVATSLIAKNNSPVYFYEFAYDGSQNYLKKKMNIDRKGACHGDEGGYLIKSDILPTNLTDTDRIVRERMVEMWTNFVKHGDPTPQTNEIITTKWEPIAETGLAYILIDDKLTMKHELYPKRIEFISKILFPKFSGNKNRYETF